MITKKAREMYINEVPIHEITQELYDLVLMLYDDCEDVAGMKRMKDDLNNSKYVISGIQDLSYILNEKTKAYM